MIYRILLLTALLCSSLSAAPPVRVIVEDADGKQHVFIPDTEPPVEPDPAPRPHIGINLAGVTYWSTERPFNDLGKMLSPWQWSTNTSWNNLPAFPIDANGYPTAVAANTFAGAVLDMHPGMANTEYRIEPSAGVQIDRQTTPGAFRKTGDPYRLLLRVRAGIQSLSIREATNTDTDLFYKPFLERTSKFGILRFMNWSRTNEERPISWDTRTTRSWFSQADKEVCWEYQLDLAELCDSSPWLCVHHRADDAYVRSLAKLVKQEYDGDRPIYLEHSNEVWNAAFSCYRYCLDRSPLTRSPLEFHIARTAQIARIFREEGVHVISVLGAQSAAPDHFSWLLTRLGAFPEDIDAIAIAPYFGYSISPAAKAGTVDQILDECEASIQAVGGQITQWKAITDKLGLQLVAYEAGQHLAPFPQEHNNVQLVNIYIAANRHPRMGQLYRSYLQQWDRITGKSPIVLFESCSPPGVWGSWGLMEHSGQSRSQAVKLDAVISYMEGP